MELCVYRIDRPVVSVLVLDTVLDCQDSELIKYLVLVLQEYRISKKLLVKLMEAKYWAVHSCARHICSLSGTYAHTCTHMRVHAHAQTHTRTHSCMHACVPAICTPQQEAYHAISFQNLMWAGRASTPVKTGPSFRA